VYFAGLLVETREVDAQPREVAHALEQRAHRRRRRVAGDVVGHLRPQPDRRDPLRAQLDLEHRLHPGRASVVGAHRTDFLGERPAGGGREHRDGAAVRSEGRHPPERERLLGAEPVEALDELPGERRPAERRLRADAHDRIAVRSTRGQPTCGHVILRVSPSSTETVGRVCWRSRGR
jgi:hypothetical protein